MNIFEIIANLISVVIVLLGALILWIPICTIIVLVFQMRGAEADLVLFFPVIVSVVLSVVLSFSELAMHKIARLRMLTKDERVRIEQSGVQEVLEKSGAKINHILVTDEMHPNALAIGRGTVGFTQGVLMPEVSDSMLRGIVAHEAGHIAAGDTKSLGMFFAFDVILNMLNSFWQLLLNLPKMVKGGAGTFIVLFLLPFFIVGGIYSILLWLNKIIQMVMACRAEYRADEYAHKLGHREGLVEFLQVLAAADTKPGGLLSSALDTHPSPTSRIERLLKLDAIAEKEDDSRK